VNFNLKDFSVLNRRNSQGSNNERFLKERKEFVYLSCIIIQRKAFSNAIVEGVSVIELKTKDKKAILKIK
jgi:hypothetical protein